jgi:hypothetical protein
MIVTACWDAAGMDDNEVFQARPDRRSDRLDHLIECVGDADALTHLDDEPLPDEPLDWSAIEECDRPFVTQVASLSDRCCDELLDTEFRTITRRILARAAARDPRVLRRSTNAHRCAAGLVWLAGRANGEFGRRGKRTSQRLWDWFGVTDCADRGRSLRRAAGLESDTLDAFCWDYEPLSLGEPTLLHSRFRSGLIAQRDALVALGNSRRHWSMADDGRTARVDAEPIGVVAVTKGVVEEGTRVAVVLALGHELEDARFFALSIPDAHELSRALQRALDDPLPRHVQSVHSAGVEPTT